MTHPLDYWWNQDPSRTPEQRIAWAAGVLQVCTLIELSLAEKSGRAAHPEERTSE